jgi:hypothetical protein
MSVQLIETLGIQEGSLVGLLNPPERFYEALQPLPPRVEVFLRLEGRFDVVIVFCQTRLELEAVFPKVHASMRVHSVVWIGHPNPLTELSSDLNEDRGWVSLHRAGYKQGEVHKLNRLWTIREWRLAESLAHLGRGTIKPKE